MSRIQFYQNNYIGKKEGETEIKICPSCKTVFSVNEDDCPKCSLYLPSFPTSWARSATNIFLLRKVLEFIYIEFNGLCNISNLTDVLVENYIISVDLKRKNDKKYWRGGQ